MRPIPTILSVALLALSVGGCASSAKLQSTPPPSTISVDGDLEDWASALTRFEDGRLMVGVRDDGERLFVAVRVNDPGTVRQIQMGGLQLWLDPDGGKDAAAGVQYPLGMLAFNRGRSGQMPLPAGRMDPDEMRRMFDATLEEFGVLAKEMQTRRIPVGSLPGVETSARLEFGSLTYELSLPMTGSDELGLPPISSAAGFGLALRSGARERREGPIDRSPTAGPGGAVGGRAGGGGMGGMRPGGRQGGARAAQVPSPLDLWIQIGR